MKVEILAADSMGTRSMATYIETKDVSILVDPATALGPKRYRLPPHPTEEKKLKEHWKKIKKYAKKSDVLIVTHYHYDHHNPEEFLEIYKDKKVFVKHPKENINKSQTKRASVFLKKIEGLAEEIIYSDGKEFDFKDTKIKFSPAVFHGTNSRLGYVTEVFVKDSEKSFLHTSDVEGPAIKDQLDFILDNCPEIIFADGPMTYMLGFRYSYDNMNKSIENLLQIIKKCKPEYLILDHHFLRDLKWKQRIEKLYEQSGDTKVVCAAEFMGQSVETLEAHRKELCKKDK